MITELKLLQDKGDKFVYKSTNITSIKRLSAKLIAVLSEVFTAITLGKGHNSFAFKTSFLLVKTLPYKILLGAEVMSDGNIFVDIPQRLF
uniref:Uncharacterized protein n=1 Tax=Romanomermis culicivorax TaxID=13658 RepID=A0A915JZV9_ROMCU